MKQILFVTGTDTGVGKTLLTAMLVSHLRKTGVNALAMKPFCSGGTEDIELLSAAQDGVLTHKEINPFYFTKPLAPLAAGGKHVPLATVLKAIKELSARCETLVVEGSGGLLVPLGQRYFVIDLIAALQCETILVAKNKLGTINHTLLSHEAMKNHCVNTKPRILLMGQARPDLSAASNLRILRQALPGVQILAMPYVGAEASGSECLQENCKKCKKLLAQLARRT